MLIGGLNADLWVGRMVRLSRSKKPKGNGSRSSNKSARGKSRVIARLLWVTQKGQACVKIPNHGHTETVGIVNVKPWWSGNPDLAERHNHDRSNAQ